MGCLKRVLERTDYKIWTLMIGGWSKETGIHFRCCHKMRAILWLGIWLNLVYREERHSSRIKQYVIGREVAVTYFDKERNGVWYFVDSIVAMFLSVLTQNYEMALVSFCQGPRITLTGWFSVRLFMCNRRITCPSCDCQAGFWMLGTVFSKIS